MNTGNSDLPTSMSTCSATDGCAPQGSPPFSSLVSEREQRVATTRGSCSERDVEREQPALAVGHRLQRRRDSRVHFGGRFAELERADEGREDHLELVDGWSHPASQ